MDGSLHDDGFQIERGLIDPDVVHDVRDFLERALEPTMNEMRALGVRVGEPEMVDDINRLLSAPNAAEIDRDLRVVMTGHFPLNTRLDRRLWAIPQAARVREFLTDLLGEKSLRMHMPPTARFVYPGNADAAVPAHQDITYNRHMSDFVTFWVPLVPIDERCGGVTVFPGSDKAELPTEMMDHGIWFKHVETSGISPVDCAPMVPGDVLVFNRLLVHRSMANTSDRIRFSLDYRFFPASASSTKHYLDMDRWEVVDPHG